MCYVFFQQKDKVKQYIYIVSKVFNVAKAKYQKIERLALAIVVTAWKL